MSPALRVALVHYHLRPGGVTSVLRHAAAGLAAHGAACVTLAGAPPPAGAWPGPVQVVPGLDYEGASTPVALRASLERAAAAALGGSPDVWYVHNHSLGRSPALPGAVRALADAGAALLLHLHDFPEDGRPAPYQRLRTLAGPAPRALDRLVYPCGPRVHYAVLTTRDAALLAGADAPPARVHLLPNPVVLDGPPPGPPPAGGGRLYPTRAIRRKNLGEFLLWAATSPPGPRWATTLAPRSAADCAAYDRWVTFAQDRRLPVDFAVGARAPEQPLTHWLAGAAEVYTTSVGEGFGLAFLEPWLAGRLLRGRDLPALTADFRAAGVTLSGLYERLDVPLRWAGADDLRAALTRALLASRAAYGRTLPGGAVEQAWSAAVRGTEVDFGRLDESLQLRVLEQVLRAGPDWTPPIPAPVSDEVLASNRRAVATAFRASACAARLWTACQAVAAGGLGAVDALDAGALLDAFLDPQQFCLLRT